MPTLHLSLVGQEKFQSASGQPKEGDHQLASRNTKLKKQSSWRNVSSSTASARQRAVALRDPT